ncbi:MAG: sulfatase-like hydrolase/transferase [Planctomycetes bacterium]|nr:sulfatase-like hydrolase/transferase [Planctomycetota bacterium]
MKLCIGLLCLLVGACSQARPGIPPRHLLLVTVEALRADASSAYSSMRPTTSFASTELERREGRALGIDNLAASGVLFRVCMSPSARTEPALASLFTGLSPQSAGLLDGGTQIRGDAPTLAELFADSGFRTAAFVTVGATDLKASVGRGFESFLAGADDAATLWSASEWLKRDPGDGSRRFTWIHLAGAVPPFELGSDTAGVESLLGERDFGPMLSVDECRAWARGALTLADDGLRTRAANTYARAVARTSIALTLCLQSAYDYTQSNGDVSETWARTALIFTAPSGLLLGESDIEVTAETTHEKALHVPLVLRHPDSMTGERVSGAVVELQDLLPTCVAWFDLATPRHVAGRSLLALLDTYIDQPFDHRPAVSVARDGVVSVRDTRYHLILDAKDPAHGVRLYEPERDPTERENLSSRYPDVVRRLARAAADAVHSPP